MTSQDTVSALNAAEDYHYAVCRKPYADFKNACYNYDKCFTCEKKPNTICSIPIITQGEVEGHVLFCVQHVPHADHLCMNMITKEFGPCDGPLTCGAYSESEIPCYFCNELKDLDYGNYYISNYRKYFGPGDLDFHWVTVCRDCSVDPTCMSEYFTWNQPV